MQPAARQSDPHICPMLLTAPPFSPHGPASIPLASLNVTIGGQPALRAGDSIVCAGAPPNAVSKGSATVLINGMPAARTGDPTAHGGVLGLGDATVLIGG